MYSNVYDDVTNTHNKYYVLFPTISTSTNIRKTVKNHWDRDTWNITGCSLNVNGDIQGIKVQKLEYPIQTFRFFRICKSSEAVTRRCSANQSSEKFRKIYRKTPVPESLY